MAVVDGGVGAVKGTRSSVMLRGSSCFAVSNMALPKEVKGNVLQYRILLLPRAQRQILERPKVEGYRFRSRSFSTRESSKNL